MDCNLLIPTRLVLLVPGSSLLRHMPASKLYAVPIEEIKGVKVINRGGSHLGWYYPGRRYPELSDADYGQWCYWVEIITKSNGSFLLQTDAFLPAEFERRLKEIREGSKIEEE